MIVTIAVTLIVCGIYGLIHKGWVESKIETLHNRINAANSETDMLFKDVKGKVQNAQAIASNALSSAQRAESKVTKHIEETTNKEEKKND